MSAAGHGAPLALTMGDPAGIGPDITLSAWARRNELDLPAFVYLGDPSSLAARAEALGISAPLRQIDSPGAAGEIFGSAIPILPFFCPPVTPGTPDVAAAPAVIGAIEAAVALTLEGACSAVVTNPIAKSVVAQGGFAYPGHTEFLAALSARGGPEPLPVMMLAAPELRVVPVTTHIALSKVPQRLTGELIVQISRITADGLTRFFGVAHPRLMVAGLNPHAGENGLMGTEDAAIIRPAVEQLVREGIDAVGPVSADTMFHAEARARYDAAICMYHDQALIPVKTLAFDSAVNTTLGLPFLRTSPDHGTAFSLAGSGRAHDASLIAALRLAASGAPASRRG